MAPRGRTVRLALGPGAVGILIGGLALGWFAFGAAEAARRPLGWAVAGGVVAAVLAPVVDVLSRWVPRLVAVLAVFLLVGAAAGLVVAGTLRDLDDQANRLKETAPEAAAELERSGGIVGDIADGLALEQRVTTLIEDLERPSSGVAEDVASSAGAWVVSIVLTAFFLSWGPRLTSAALRQVGDPDKRERTGAALALALANGRRYILGTLSLAIVSGIAAGAACDVAGLPAPLALAIAVGAASVIPAVGVLVGAVPVVLLELALGTTFGAVQLAVFFVALQAAHILVMRRVVIDHSLIVGPAAIVIALVVGFDVYGVGGAFYAAALAVFGVALVDAVGVVRHEQEGEAGSGAASTTPSA